MTEELLLQLIWDLESAFNTTMAILNREIFSKDEVLKSQIVLILKKRAEYARQLVELRNDKINTGH
jgi:translation initiation factor 2 alpha subunit (eIF-2alpha)